MQKVVILNLNFPPLNPVPKTMEAATLTRRFTPEEYFAVLDRPDIKVELVDGEIIPKESRDPLPVWVVEELLKPDFNTDILDDEFPVATTRHDRIANNLVFILRTQLDESDFEVTVHAPKVYITISRERIDYPM